MLKQTFTLLISNYSKNNSLANKLWQEIEKKYSSKKRYYHTLTHLENLYTQLLEIKHLTKQWDILLFTLYYHDIIYNVLKQNNEEQSAIFAQKRMKEIGVPNILIQNCTSQIIATKKHLINKDLDTNFFTDADLSILGKPWHEYADYYKKIRKEYAIYPNIIYNAGRKKVLQHFIAMNKIYKTDFFYEKFEVQAKQNLKLELETLL